MTQFPGIRQPALTLQDAAMLPALTAGNLARQIANAGAFIPVTTTFDSTTSSTTLNNTVASSRGGSLRSLMMPINAENWAASAQSLLPINTVPPCAQFGTCQGSSAGQAILGAGGANMHGFGCGCTCTRELGEEVIIDEDNTNGIDDGDEMVLTAPETNVPAVQVTTVPVAAAPATTATTVPVVNVQPAAAAAAPATSAANVQYVTYNV